MRFAKRIRVNITPPPSAGLVQASVYKFLPLPPLLTMMSEDGLLFKFLGDVDKETGVHSYLTYVILSIITETPDYRDINTN